MKTNKTIVGRAIKLIGKVAEQEKTCLVMLNSGNETFIRIVGNPGKIEEDLYKCVKQSPEMIEIFDKVAVKLSVDKLDKLLRASGDTPHKTKWQLKVQKMQSDKELQKNEKIDRAVEQR